MSSTSDLQAKTASPRRAPRLVLELPPAAYIASWFFIVAFHATCGVYLICVAMTYWYLTTGTMPFYVSNYSLTGTQNYHFYGFVFGVVGGMHGVQLINILMLSIRAKRLTLQSHSGFIRAISKRILSSHLKLSTNNLRARSPTSMLSRFTKTTGRAWHHFFSRQGLFGVESEHFSTIFTLREVLEASSQTYQAYRASNLLPRAELNSIIVGLLIFNCWSTAAIQFFLRKTPALERVVTLTYDASISFGIMTVVPLMIFIPYVEAFDIPKQLFKNGDFLYNPVAITKLVLENRLIFASSLFDFGTKLIPQLSIILSLVTVTELLGRGGVKVIPGAGSQGIQSLAVKSVQRRSSDPKKTEVNQKTLWCFPE